MHQSIIYDTQRGFLGKLKTILKADVISSKHLIIVKSHQSLEETSGK